MKNMQELEVMFSEDQSRVETGVVQFNDDWPGVFIRGDSAFHFARSLAIAIKHLEKTEIDFLTMSSLRGLQKMLDESNICKKDNTNGD